MITASGLQHGALGLAWRAIEDVGLRVTRARLCSRLANADDADWASSSFLCIEFLGEAPCEGWDGIAAHLQTDSAPTTTSAMAAHRHQQPPHQHPLPSGSLVSGFSALDVEKWSQRIFGGSSVSTGRPGSAGGSPAATSSRLSVTSGGAATAAHSASGSPGQSSTRSQSEGAAAAAPVPPLETVTPGDVAVLLILPSVVAGGLTGRVIRDIEDGLRTGPAGDLHISALQTHACLSRSAAEEYLFVYKGILPGYSVRAAQLQYVLDLQHSRFSSGSNCKYSSNNCSAVTNLCFESHNLVYAAKHHTGVDNIYFFLGMLFVLHAMPHRTRDVCLMRFI